VRVSTPLEAAEREGGAWRLSFGRAGEARVKVLVDAAGAWAAAIGDLAGVRVPVAPVRHQLLITDKVAGVAEHRGGLFTMTADARFLLGPVPGLTGFWLATGCNGSGFSFSPALGQVMAEWIADGEPSIDITEFSPARFATQTLSDEDLTAACVWQYAHYYDPAE
jgi:glycine/D-amino acid oxidase-like deaminating enzyme